MVQTAGIDDLNLYATTLAVEFSEIAACRNMSEKDLHNVGFRQRSVLPNYEDPVTLAVNAAKPIIDAAGAEAFELLIVATETGLDYGKPMSSYVHQGLELPSCCRHFEIKNACFGGTAALQSALSWVRAEACEDKKALVVMTDIARRHFDDPAEFTAGAGAVAVSIGLQPRVMEIAPKSGRANREIYDVARPTPTFEYGNPVLSLYSYLDLLELAWEDYCRCAGTGAVEEHFDYMLYHTPLISLVKRAHQVLLETDESDWESEAAGDTFTRMVEPALVYNRDIGNIYSGSIYAALAGLIDTVAVEEGTRVGLFSYGSGASAELFKGTICRQAKEILSSRHIGEMLKTRRILHFKEYEPLILALERDLNNADFEPDWEFPDQHYAQTYEGRGRFVLERVEQYHRTYKWS